MFDAIEFPLGCRAPEIAPKLFLQSLIDTNSFLASCRRRVVKVACSLWKPEKIMH